MPASCPRARLRRVLHRTARPPPARAAAAGGWGGGDGVGWGGGEPGGGGAAAALTPVPSLHGRPPAACSALAASRGPRPRPARRGPGNAARSGFSACPPGGYRLPQDVLKQTKLLFLLPIPPPAPQPSADVGRRLGQLCPGAPHPRGPPGGLPRNPGEGRAVHLHVCKFLVKIRPSR